MTDPSPSSMRPPSLENQASSRDWIMWLKPCVHMWTLVGEVENESIGSHVTVGINDSPGGAGSPPPHWPEVET